MKIELIITNTAKNNFSGIQIYNIQNELYKINMYFFNEKNNAIFGRLDFMWMTKEDRWCSENLDFYPSTYVIVNDKDKFYVNDKEDLIKFYSWLTGIDYNKKLKELQEFAKAQNISKDFQ